jgi:hypothetical protein
MGIAISYFRLSEMDIPLVPAGTMLLLLLEIGILFGGADEACDIDDIVLAVSAVNDGDLMDETGDTIDRVVMDGDFNGCIGCIGICACCCGSGCCA